MVRRYVGTLVRCAESSKAQKKSVFSFLILIILLTLQDRLPNPEAMAIQKRIFKTMRPDGTLMAPLCRIVKNWAILGDQI